METDVQRIIVISDGTGNNWAFITLGKPDLIGHHYTLYSQCNNYGIEPAHIKVKMLNDAFCETDLHYWERKSKEPIPKDTECEIIYYWRNFYGDYVNVEYNGKKYDIATKNIEILRK